MQRAGSAEAGQRDLVPLFVHRGQAGFGEEGRILDYYLLYMNKARGRRKKVKLHFNIMTIFVNTVSFNQTFDNFHFFIFTVDHLSYFFLV